MNKYLLFIGLLLVVFSSCKKDSFNPATQATKDDAAIQAYISANSITGVTKDASGLYYKVEIQGTGDYPTVNSLITANYTGKLLNGTVFDSGTINTQLLSSTIKGWQIGVPHVNTGGRILLLIPSALGYANSATGNIPANSVLIFTIDLTGFSN